MMCHVTLMSRTFSTSVIHREVIHAHGQVGSNQKSTGVAIVLQTHLGCIAEIVLLQSYAASMRNNGAPLSISVPGSAIRATCLAPRATTGTTGLRAPVASICHSTMIS